MLMLKGFDDFANPSSAYRQMMFWSWNSVMTRERITEMLEQFAERGIGGAFVHARPGLVTEYLSDEWWQLWSHALAECKRLGLECQIYDENAFPSAFAGGHVMANRPHVGAAGVSCVAGEKPPPSSGRVIATIADQAGRSFRLVHIPEAARERMGGFPFVDILNPEATQEFLAVTHEEYAKRYADAFGTTIKYAFTDEPDLHGGDGFHWTDYLVDEFEREHGYNLRERLADLGFSTPASSEVRFDYWSTVNRLFIHSFAKPVYEWCAKHRLAFTGHYWDHTWPAPARQPSNMALLRWMQMPGIDLLGFQFDHRDRAKSGQCIVYLKEVSSVANQLGCKRVLCEGYGGRGYDMALRDFKPISDYLLANGVNLNAPHLSHVSVAGVRKYEWPQTLTDHASWWDEYRLIADHEARLTYTACQGRTTNRVLLLHPTTSAWLHYVPKSFDVTDATHRDVTWMERLEQSQRSLITALADQQIDFDLGDEFVLAEFASAGDGRLKVGSCSYERVIVPEMMENVLDSTVDVLRAYLAAGGTVLALGETPSRVNGRTSDAVHSLVAADPQQWIRLKARSELVERIRLEVPPRITAVDGGALPKDLHILRRERDDGTVVLITANPFEQELDTRVRIEGKGLYALDTANGKIVPQESEPCERGQIARLKVGPSGCVLWVAVCGTEGQKDGLSAEALAKAEGAEGQSDRRTGKTSVPSAISSLGTSEAVRLGAPTIERLSPNVLPLDYCDVTVGGMTHEGIAVTAADTEVWRQHGFAENAWLGVQYRRKYVDRTFAADSGFSVTYRFRVSSEVAPEAIKGLAVGVERPWLYAIELNGRSLDSATAERFFDEHMRLLCIGAFVKPGENELRMTARPFNVLCEVVPVWIVGDFALSPDASGFTIGPASPLKLGEWRQQGLPFYAGQVRYRLPFELKGKAQRLSVKMGDWTGSVARVSLDGSRIGALAWPPFELAIDGPMGEGAHEFTIEIAGNMKNLMGPHFSEGLPGIWSWRQCPKHSPHGSEYRFYPTGMMTTPSVRVVDG